MTKVSKATQRRRTKAAVQTIIDGHRSAAFNEVIAVMVAASPNASSRHALRFFNEAWIKSLGEHPRCVHASAVLNNADTVK